MKKYEPCSLCKMRVESTPVLLTVNKRTIRIAVDLKICDMCLELSRIILREMNRKSYENRFKKLEERYVRK